MLYFLIPVFFAGIYLAWFYSKKAQLDKIRKRMNTRKYQKEKSKRLQGFHGSTRKQKMLAASTGITTIVGTLIAIYGFHSNPVIGFVLGGVLPAFFQSIYQEKWMDRYNEDVVHAIEFGASVFEVGQTVEQWVVEVADELEGPLAPVFRRGAMQVKDKQSVIDFLEYLVRTTPNQYFAYVVAGIISNYETGDMVQFMDEVLDEQNLRQRYIRVMRQQRKEAMNLLLAMSGFPVFLYAMFSQRVNEVLNQSFVDNVVFGAGMLGYLVLLWFARRTAIARRL